MFLGQQFWPSHLLTFQFDLLQTTDTVRHQVRLYSAQPLQAEEPVYVGGWKTFKVSSLSFVAERRRFAMSFV